MTRILLVNQFSQLKTGFGIVGNDLLNYLHKKYEVAELAIDANPNDPRISQCPWKVYANNPLEHEKSRFKSFPNAVFGAWKFEDVCLDFKPTHVLSINDIWCSDFLAKSPLRRFYNFIWMPTLDAAGMSPEWKYELSLADVLLAYQNWSAEQLEKESGIKVFGIAPHVPQGFTLVENRKELKKHLGLDGFVIGTVMRNQARKRFPELFSLFRKVLDKHPNAKLYCHTSFPDKQGWNIPRLLIKNDIAHNVYFSYICSNCGNLFPSLYRGVTFCNKCKQMGAILCNGVQSMSTQHMNIMYNAFDLYVQFTVAEGFGIPMLEAAACGTPVIATNYTSMEDIVPKINGKLIDCVKQQEITSDRLMAVPSQEHTIQLINETIEMSEWELNGWRNRTYEGFRKHFKLDDSLKMWEMAINSCGEKDNWHSPPEIHKPPQWDDRLNQLSNSEFVKWLILNILKDESKIGTFFEHNVLNELNWGTRFNPNEIVPINRKMIFNEFVNIRNYMNYWEYRRVQS